MKKLFVAVLLVSSSLWAWPPEKPSKEKYPLQSKRLEDKKKKEEWNKIKNLKNGPKRKRSNGYGLKK